MSLKEEIVRDFPGQYTVVPFTLYKRVKQIVQTYALTNNQETDLLELVANLPAKMANEYLTALEVLLADL